MLATKTKCSGNCPDCGNATCASDIRAEVPIFMDNGITAQFVAFNDFPDGKEHIALKLGTLPKDGPPLVRIHSECLTGDVFGSSRCDCGPQLQEALERISEVGGILLYLRQEGRGIGLAAKLETYTLQDIGYDTYAANEALNLPRDGRDYEVAATMLREMGITEVQLLTNNKRKIEGLQKYGISVVNRVATSVFKTEQNAKYLAAKRNKGDHQLELEA